MDLLDGLEAFMDAARKRESEPIARIARAKELEPLLDHALKQYGHRLRVIRVREPAPPLGRVELLPPEQPEVRTIEFTLRNLVLDGAPIRAWCAEDMIIAGHFVLTMIAVEPGILVE